MKQSIFLRQLIKSAAIVSVLLGLLVLIGWYSHTVELIQVLPIFVPMQYNTALGFLLGGSAILLIYHKKMALSRVLLAIVGCIGFLTLVEYSMGVNLHIDELFMKHYITVETSHPGRMAPNTALCFLLSSVALSLTVGKGTKKMQISSILGALIFGLGIIAFIGYLIGMEVTYGGGKLTRMAVHTAIGFMILGTGVTALNLYQENHYSGKKNLNKDAWLMGYAFSLALIIFFIDLSLPLGVAIGIPYVLFVLFAWFIKQEGITTVLAICSTVLILAGYIYSAEGSASGIVIANRVFAIMAVWMVAGLVHHIKRKETDLLLSNQQLDQHVLELSNKNKELAQFTYIASHDLQEPLRTVTNFTHLFEKQYREVLDEQANTYLQFIAQASRRMSGLIKGLLDYSRIGHNREMTYVDLEKILDELKIDLHSKIDETGAKFRVGPLPKIRGFRVELALLFQNLILNAIKFRRKEEKPEIIITAKDRIGFFEFIVQDNGIGIAEEHQKKIFSIFQRLHTRKEYEGTGIGLAHCQKIVELHQGTIRVSSVPEQGSKFIFTIKK